MDPRNLTQAQSTSSDIAWLFLLTVTPSSGAPIYLVNNNEQIVSRGITYEPFPFSLTLPSDNGESMPKVTLNIANFSDDLVTAIRGFETAPKVKVELVTSAYPDIVEKSLDWLVLRGVTYDAMAIQCQLEVLNIMNLGFPAETYDPIKYPALFR